MKIRSKKFNAQLFYIEPWPSVGVPIGDGWDFERGQVVRAVRKIRRAGKEALFSLVRIAYDPWPCCYTIRDHYSLVELSDDEIRRIIDNGGYWAIVCEDEKQSALVSFINDRKGIYCDNN